MSQRVTVGVLELSVGSKFLKLDAIEEEQHEYLFLIK